MKREFLVGLGLDNDAINQIMAVHGSEVNTLNEKIATLETSRSQLDEQLKQRDEQLEGLKGQNVDDLKQRIDELQKDNADLKEQHANELKENARKHKIEMLANGLSDREDVREFAMFKLQELELKDGELVGADEAIAQLKEANPNIFSTQQEPSKPKWSQGKVSTVATGTMTKAEVLAIKDASERQRAIAQNIHLFN